MDDHRRKAQEYFDKGEKCWPFKYKSAIKQYRRAVRYAPKWAEAHWRLGQALQQAKRPVDEVVREFRAAVRLKPEWNVGHWFLAGALRDAGLLDGAIREYKEALRLDPSHAWSYILLGDCLIESGRMKQGVKMTRKGIDLHPAYAEADARCGLAHKLFENGFPEEAREEWKTILNMKPCYPSYDKPMLHAKQMLKAHGDKPRNSQ